MFKLTRKKKRKTTEKCRLNGQTLQKRICFKETSRTGQEFGFIRHNKLYIQVKRTNRGVWIKPNTGILRLIFGA